MQVLVIAWRKLKSNGALPPLLQLESLYNYTTTRGFLLSTQLYIALYLSSQHPVTMNNIHPHFLLSVVLVQ